MKKPTTVRTEEEVRQYIHAVALDEGYSVSHVESHLTSAGIPDLCISKHDIDTWLEIKVWKPSGIVMRPSQRKWHRERADSGGTSYVVCWIRERLYVHPGREAIFRPPTSLLWKEGPNYSLEDIPKMLRLLAWVSN